jgi:ubiquinone/menaquinone biosynthesis C-methylase UbiE
MDAPGHAPEVIADNLEDLCRVNRWLGGVRLTLVPLARLERCFPAGTTMRVLDVATGGADIPRALVRWGARRGRPLWLVASDVGAGIVAAARALDSDDRRRTTDDGPGPDRPAARGRRPSGSPAGSLTSPAAPRQCGIVFVVADATRLPFRNSAFHVVTSSLALHHLLRPAALQMLREAARCATLGVVVNDIVRSWLTYYGAIVASRLGSRNPLTRHDGPLSALRAYTTREMAGLAREAGLRPVRWDSFLLYRVAMTAVPEQRCLSMRK